MRDENYTDQEVIDMAKRLAYRTMELCLQHEVTDGRKDPIPRHRQNNAKAVVGYLMKQAEQEDKAPELGVILESMKKANDKERETADA